MRFGLNARILVRCFRFNREADVRDVAGRRTRFCFGRRAGERRSCVLRFECLAKIAVKDKTETPDTAPTHN
jgi:hypothetical protein